MGAKLSVRSGPRRTAALVFPGGNDEGKSGSGKSGSSGERRAAAASRQKKPQFSLSKIESPVSSLFANRNYDRNIDKALKRDYNEDQKVLKILILGIGGAGKSTILKQLRLLFGTPASSYERKLLADAIHRQIIEALQILLLNAEDFCSKEPSIPFISVASKEMVLGLNRFSIISSQIGESLAEIWAEDCIQKAWEFRSSNVLDSLPYFFGHMRRISHPNYVPSHTDLLYAKFRTAGAYELLVRYDSIDYKFIDVGGQRSERRKWIHLFSAIRGIIFVAALSEYDQYMDSDPSQNRLAESISVFNEVCSNTVVKEVPIFLFLNKRDLFAEKIKRVPFNSVECFSDCNETDDIRRVLRYIRYLFIKNNQHQEKFIMTHIICALDTNVIHLVFHEIQKKILWHSLKGGGLVSDFYT